MAKLRQRKQSFMMEEYYRQIFVGRAAIYGGVFRGQSCYHCFSRRRPHYPPWHAVQNYL